MIKIGMMIGDRYEILEKIGTGGMSDVYKAKDHKLNRFVAMKVLKQEFSENANFVSKFGIEAQAAAGLMHPNIVNVYDVGEENGINYIVMELVEGITLKKYIEKKARLSYKEAVSIAIQVSMGIEAAHNNHIIHRDIKPQNIIISKDGKVKVTDFGIAKAATSNTITSNVMGSVHYTSPEQARGGYSDEKSDIYSLGITMFEMLTGRVPFNGETTVAIAIKHIQEELPFPSEFVPEIPASVENIVLKCCQKSPDRRYQNTQELVADLKQSLINPDEDFVVQSEPDMDGSTRMISDGDMAQIKRQAAYQEYEEPDTMRLRSEVDEDYEADLEDVDDGDEYDYNPGMERVATILAILGGIAVCVIVIILAVQVVNGFGNPGQGGKDIINTGSPEPTGPDRSDVEYKSMPDVLGKTVEDARKTLSDMGFRSQMRYEESDVYDMGVIIRADVKTNTEIPVGTLVTLTASLGPRGDENTKDVPSVVGQSYEEAEATLRSMGFTVIKMEGYSDTVAAGIVAVQVPAALEKAPVGAPVTLTVSLGPQSSMVQVPYLIGETEGDARIILAERGLVAYVESYEYNNDYAQDRVFWQNYSSGQSVAPGTVINIKVSKGPMPTSKPVTYKCNVSIEAPTLEEAPDYVKGMSVSIKFETDDGKILLETIVRETTADTNGFPQTVNYYNLSASAGTITMTYTVEVPGTSDPDTGEEIIPPTTETRTITRRVEFVKE